MIIRIIIIVISRGRLSRTDGGGSVDDGVCLVGDEGVGRVRELGGKRVIYSGGGVVAPAA